jgi:hypothetical protein
MARTRGGCRQTQLERLTKKLIGDPKRSYLHAILLDASTADFTIHYGESTFLVHKCVLYVSNSYFQTMLSQQWNETSSCTIQPPNGASDKAFEIFLAFVYTRMIIDQNIYMDESDSPLQMKYFCELFKLADYFMEKELNDFIYYILADHLSVNNLPDLLEIYQSSSDRKIRRLFTNVVASNYNVLKLEKDFPFKIFLNDSNLLQTLQNRWNERSVLWEVEEETNFLEEILPATKRQKIDGPDV